jgi:ribonuclease HI
MIYYCDGGGWNGEYSRWGIVDQDKNLIMYAKIYGHESVTNNVAEYSAVLNAIMIAKNGDTIISDSQLVIYQLQGKYRCKALHLQPLYEVGIRLLGMKNVKLKWEPRTKNLAGIFLDSVRSKYNLVV